MRVGRRAREKTTGFSGDQIESIGTDARMLEPVRCTNSAGVANPHLREDRMSAHPAAADRPAGDAGRRVELRGAQVQCEARSDRAQLA
jgi:hypothetical protein